MTIVYSVYSILSAIFVVGLVLLGILGYRWVIGFFDRQEEKLDKDSSLD